VRRKRTTIIGPFVPIPLSMLDHPAWRAMDPLARVLWIELRRKLRHDGLNNGKIFLSCRDAAKAIGGNKDTIGRRYIELEHYGFLRRTSEGCLGSDGWGIAPHYRFTDLPHGTHSATRDYESWSGELFVYTRRRPARKKQNPVLSRRTPRIVPSDIAAPAQKTALCPTAPDISDVPRCIVPSDISRITTPPKQRAENGTQGSLTVRAPAQAGGAGSSPAPVTKLTDYVLSVVSAELEGLKAGALARINGEKTCGLRSLSP
jgi:DNA-binding transcriptional MocR family regulator